MIKEEKDVGRNQVKIKQRNGRKGRKIMTERIRIRKKRRVRKIDK